MKKMLLLTTAFIYLGCDATPAKVKAVISEEVPAIENNSTEEEISLVSSSPIIASNKCHIKEDVATCTINVAWENAPAGGCIWVSENEGQEILFACSDKTNGKKQATWINPNHKYEFFMTSSQTSKDKITSYIVTSDTPTVIPPDINVSSQLFGSLLSTTNQCEIKVAGGTCTIPIYVNSTVSTCIKDLKYTPFQKLACFPAGISQYDVAISDKVSRLLALYTEPDSTTSHGGDLFLSSIYLSASIPIPTSSKTSQPPSPLPGDCSGVTNLQCNDSQSTCLLTSSISLNPTDNCKLNLKYKLDLNGFSLESTNAQIYILQPVINSTDRSIPIKLTNITSIVPSPGDTAFIFTNTTRGVTFNNVKIHGGKIGIEATDMSLLEVDSCKFNDVIYGIKSTRLKNDSNYTMRVFHSMFYDVTYGIHMESMFNRSQLITGRDIGIFPESLCDATKVSCEAYYKRDGVSIIGNLFQRIPGIAINLNKVKSAWIFSNEIRNFQQTAIKLTDTKDTQINTTLINDKDNLTSAAEAPATTGIDMEYSPSTGVIHSEIKAKIGIKIHEHGGIYRNRVAIYYNNITAYQGIAGIWDNINITTQANPTDPWVNYISDTEVSGNNFYGYNPDALSIFSPITSFANEPISGDTKHEYLYGTKDSYPIYPFDRKHNPNSKIACTDIRNYNGRTMHISTTISEGAMTGDSAFWSGNYYYGVDKANSTYKNIDKVNNTHLKSISPNYYPEARDGFFDYPVFANSAPNNACFRSFKDSYAGLNFKLSFSSNWADNMAKVAKIDYAGLCNLGTDKKSYGALMFRQNPTVIASEFYNYAREVFSQNITSTTPTIVVNPSIDNCSYAVRRKEFPSIK